MYKLDIFPELTENIEIEITLDGIKLKNRLFNITRGFKIVDFHIRYLRFSNLLLPTDIEILCNFSIQSYNNSFIVEIYLMKDTKKDVNILLIFIIFIILLEITVYLNLIKFVL